jgi:hypothetical protein
MWALDIATALVALFFFGIALLSKWGNAHVAQEKARKREEHAHEDFVRNFSDTNIAKALATGVRRSDRNACGYESAKSSSSKLSK